MRLLLLRKCGTRTPGWTKGTDLIWHLNDIAGGLRSFLDHWGSTITEIGRRDFVSEPYMDHDRAAEFANRVGGVLGCKWYVDANSWWYPGHTIRIGFIDPSILK